MDELLKGSIANSKNNDLEYDNIANFIDSNDKFSFLSDIVPKRISFNKACNKIRKEINELPISIEMNNKNKNSNNHNKPETNTEKEIEKNGSKSGSGSDNTKCEN